jgi:Arc/MetJ family transcription regulator
MSTLKKIIYNCRQATLLLDKREFVKLTFRETIELRIHLYKCGVCKLYGQQTHVINRMVQQLLKNQEYRLDDGFKQELQSRIDEELNKI